MISKIKKNNFCDNKCYYPWLRSDKNPNKGSKRPPEVIEKIRQASLNRNYDEVLTDESRKKMADSARKKVWTEESREKLRQANLGKKLNEETKQKIRANAKYGKDNHMYKDDPSYVAIHLWAHRHIKTLLICVDKGFGNLPCTKKLELSNIDHKYRRIIEDWAWRCTRHHRIYDKLNGLTHPKGKTKHFYARAYEIKNGIQDQSLSEDTS